MYKIITVIIILNLLQDIQGCGDHYWRDYDGVIPDDAIPAGKNSNGDSYIGLVYLHDFGILLGTIVPGKSEISVPCYGVRTVNIADSIVKILCANDKRKYIWVPTNIQTYNEDTHGHKCPVLGGYDQLAHLRLGMPLGTLHIGRTLERGDVIIGNIAVYDVENPRFFYPWNNEEIRKDQYEVLVYSTYL